MRSDISRIRSQMIRRVKNGQSWLYSRTQSGTWVRAAFLSESGEVVVEYQPRIVIDGDRVKVIDLDGRVSMSMVRGVSLSDVSTEEWRRAATLLVDDIDDLYTFEVKEQYSAVKRIRDMMFMLIMLGYGQPAQEVAEWFKKPSQGEWLRDGVPYLVNADLSGIGSVEASDARCSIDGQVTFRADFVDDEVDLTMTWDRFLLSASIDIKDSDEIY